MAAVLLNLTVTAQTGGDTTVVERNINIEKEYIPELQPAKRRNIDYTVQEQSLKKSAIVYSNYASDVQPSPQFYPIDPMEQKLLNRKTPKKGFLELGFGHPINWRTEIFYPILSTSNTYLDIHADHDGFVKHNVKLIDTEIDMLLKQKIGRSDELFAAIGYKNDYYSYYGNHNIDPAEKYMFNDSPVFGGNILSPTQTAHRAGILVGAQSLKNRNGWTYHAGVAYSMMYLQSVTTTQHSVSVSGNTCKTFGNNTLNIGLNFDGNFYETSQNNVPHTSVTNNSALGLAPAYSMTWSDLDLTVGAKIFFAFNRKMVVNAMPDVKINYNIGHKMNIYGGVTGDYRLNSLESLMEECRYFDPLQEILHNTYTPVNVFAGYQIKPLSRLLIDIHADYDYTLDALQMYNTPYTTLSGNTHTTNMFAAGFTNYNHVEAALRINYNHKDRYVAHTELAYNYYDRTVLNRPTWEWNIGTEITPAKGWMVNAAFTLGTGYRGAMYDATTKAYQTINLQNRYILDLGASYTIKQRYTLFARFENLLALAPALRYQEWYGYENFGFECLIGAKISF